MVKIPNLDDLKKMGAGIIDSAKSIKYGEVVDKLKAGVESVGKKGGAVPQGDEAMKTLFQGLNESISELLQLQATEATAIKKIQSQLSDLARIIDANQKTETTQTEDKK